MTNKGPTRKQVMELIAKLRPIKLRMPTDADIAEYRRKRDEAERERALGRKIIEARKKPRGSRKPLCDTYIETQRWKNPRVTNAALWMGLKQGLQNTDLLRIVSIDGDERLVEMYDDGRQRGAPISFEGFAKRADKLRRAKAR